MDSRIDFEKAILGAVVSEAGAYLRVCDILVPQNFKYPGHAEIYKAVSELFPSKPIDLITVNYQLGGRHGYVLSQLSRGVCSSANLGYYAQVLLELNIRESFIDVLMVCKINASHTTIEAINQVIDATRNHNNQILYVLERSVPFLSQAGASGSTIESINSFTNQFMEKIKKIKSQTKSAELFNQLQNIGRIPNGDIERDAVEKLIELIKLSLSHGLDKELSTQIIELYEQYKNRI